MPVEPSYMCQPQRFTQAPGLLRYYRPLLGPMRATADFTGPGYLLMGATIGLAYGLFCVHQPKQRCIPLGGKAPTWMRALLPPAHELERPP